MADPFVVLPYLRLEDGSRWADRATREQLADIEAILDRESLTPFHWLGRGRGWSKTTDGGMGAIEVLLHAPPGSRSYAFGADRDQAALIVDVLAGTIRRGGKPLADVFEVQAWKIVVRETGASLEAMAADEAGAWGLRPHFVFVDELPMWPSTRAARRLWEAVSSAIPKTSGARLVVAGTAGDPAHWSARVREHAIGDPLWRVSETHGPPPWMDAELVAEQRRRLPDSSFRRLFQNEWVSGEDRLVDEEDLAACVTLDGPQDPEPGHRYVIGLDVGLKRDSTVACVCHLHGGIVTLDRIGVWTGSRLHPVKLGDVEEWIAVAAREYGGAHVITDPWQAMQLIERLRRGGTRIDEYPFSQQSIGRLASSLFLLLRERSLRLPDDEELLDELRNVRLRETSPGVLRLDHDSGRHDDRAIALALAAHRLVERGERRRDWGSGVPQGLLPPVGVGYDGEGW